MNIYKKEDMIDGTIPETFKKYEIEHHVAMLNTATDIDITHPNARLAYLKKLATDGKLVQITGASPIFNKVTAVASGSLPTTGNNFNMGTVSKWLETSDDTFMDVLIGWISDHHTELEVSYPGGQRIGGTKVATAVRLTEDESNYFNPRLNLLVYKRAWIPSFWLYNTSLYSIRFFKMKAIGYKYSFVKVIPESITNSYMPVSWRVFGEVKVA